MDHFSHTASSGSRVRRIGFDLASVVDIERAISAAGPRYLRRTFTHRELTAWGERARPLAGCWAAKEAVLKLLAPEREAVGPLQVEVVPACPSGRVCVSLSGSARALAARRGITQIHAAVSSSHTSAAAVAVGAVDR